MNHRTFSIFVLLILGLNAEARTDATLLESIAQVESGMNRKAVGKAWDALAEGQHWLDIEVWNAAKDGKPTE